MDRQMYGGAEGRWIRDICALKIYHTQTVMVKINFYRAHLGAIVPSQVWSLELTSSVRVTFKISLFAVKQRVLM